MWVVKLIAEPRRKEAMKDKQNDKFIRFLKIYGPWTGSNNQFDEYVSDNAVSLGIEPFNFDIPDMLEYEEQLQKLIEAKRSQIVLISGQAGDGKTHMLRKMYSNTKLIGAPAHLWQEQLNNKELISSFTYRGIHYTVVRDLSTIDDDAKLLELSVALAKALGITLPKLKDSAPLTIESNDYPEMVLIAGNNGKILERFKRLNELFVSELIDSTIIEHLERHMINHTGFSHKHISCFDLSLCLNKEVVSNIYDQIYRHERWQHCAQCSRYEVCPILFNRSLLLQAQVKERVLAMYHLLADNGNHFTVRNILVELINALLGNKAANAPERFFTCTKVFNATKEDSYKLNELISPPFDNLLGLNLTSSNSKKLSDIAPIFEQLDELKIGQYSNRLIDRFIMLGKDSPTPALKDTYERLVNNYGFAPIVQKLQDALNKVMQEEYSEAKNKSMLESMQAPLHSLRAMLFFTMPKDSIFNPFLLTSLNYGQEYLNLKSLVMSATNLGGNNIAKALIVGLNRAFTNLMVIGEDQQLFVTTNNELNDELLTVVDDKERFILRCDFANSCSEQVLKIVPSILLGEHHDVMCLAFYGKQSDARSNYVQYKAQIQSKLNVLLDQITQASESSNLALVKRLNEHVKQLQEELAQLPSDEVQYHLRSVKDSALRERYYRYGSTAPLVCYLKLTPKIFEYLMSLAAGKMSISFSQESEQTLRTFKDNLLSYLGSHHNSPEEGRELKLMSIGNKEYCANFKNQALHIDDEQIRLINERINNIIFCSVDNNGKIK